MLGLVVGTIIIGAIFISSKSKTETKAMLSSISGAEVLIDHAAKTVGDIGFSDGILYHSFPIRNNGTKDLEIANMTTSCMCTKVFLRQNGKDGPSFGMKGMSAPSDWKGILRPGEEGEVVAAFDPAYHGPQGVGKISRFVSFETNDPDNPYVEFSFEGNVVK